MLPFSAKGENMNAIVVYTVQIIVTVLVSLGGVIYLSRSLQRVLVDLCGTEERAKFWIHFASIVLIGIPLTFGMGFNPAETVADKVFFEAAAQVRSNLWGFLMALLGLGAVVSFFSLVAPKPTVMKEKAEGA
jgi:hypothetical protein